jgi:hypothetical protein
MAFQISASGGVTTSMPDDTNEPGKPAGEARGRVYCVNLTDAIPAFDLNESGNESALTADEISKGWKDFGLDPTRNMHLETYSHEQ